MQFDKATIVNLLKERGDTDQAQQAQQELPAQVDHEEHAGLLGKFGLDPHELLGRLGVGGVQAGGSTEPVTQRDGSSMPVVSPDAPPPEDQR